MSSEEAAIGGIILIVVIATLVIAFKKLYDWTHKKQLLRGEKL